MWYSHLTGSMENILHNSKPGAWPDQTYATTRYRQQILHSVMYYTYMSSYPFDNFNQKSIQGQL